MNRLVPHRKTRARTHNWSLRKYATVLLLAVVVLSLITTTVNAASPASVEASVLDASPSVGTTMHPIQYAIAGPPSMVDNGSLAYFKAHGFSIVELVVPDNQTYQKELNTIEALGMQPVIDVEMVIWDGGVLSSTPITSFQAYFQSLKTAGWEYVASEGGRSGDPSYIKSLGLGYVNYNCDDQGLWSNLYIDSGTVANSWESYYTAEWPYIQNGSEQAAALGIQNGVMAALWANVNSDNQIYANSVPGSSSTPSYLSMLNWSYANGIGFNQFCVWCGNDPNALSDYNALEFPQIVANLQTYYPAISALSATISAATVYADQNFTISGTLSASDTLSAGTTGIAAATITLQNSTNDATWNNVTTTATNATGAYQFSNNESAPNTYDYRTTYAGNATYLSATSNVVSVNITTPPPTVTPASSPAVTAQNANSLDLFVNGTDGALWYKYWTGTTWTAPTSLGGNVTSSPAATSRAPGDIDVFARGPNGALWSDNTTNNGTTWNGWYQIGGQLAPGTGPAAVALGTNSLDAFVQGTDNVLWYTQWNGTTWSPWHSLGGVLTSSPAATAPASGTIDVFVRGTDGAIWQRTTPGGSSWSGWTSLGGQIASGTGPAASSWSSGRLDVFVEGTNGAMYQKTWNGASWSGWQSLGGVLTSSPAATAPASGTIDVFVRGSDNGLWEKTYNGAWSGWTSAGGI